jgi:hypothetical protein
MGRCRCSRGCARCNGATGVPLQPASPGCNASLRWDTNSAAPKPMTSAMTSMSCGYGEGGSSIGSLSFFHGQRLAVLAHALTKEGQVPPADIERALRRKDAFAQDPETHSYAEELQHGEDDRRTDDPRSHDRR